MINKIKVLFRLRRQNDSVKIIMLLLLLSSIFLCLSVRQGYLLYNYINEGAEYELELPNTRAGSTINTEALTKIKNIEALSESYNNNIAFSKADKEESQVVTYVSEDYLKTVYGIDNDNSMPTFYMGDKSFNKLCKLFNNIDENEQQNQYICTYKESEKAAKAYIKKCSAIKDEALILCVANNHELIQQRTSLRMYLEKKDIDGLVKYELNNAGYSYKEELVVENEQLKQKIIWQRMISNLYLSIATSVFGYIYYKFIFKIQTV